ncbi:MAG: hypothetical protein AB7S38_08390 [Vulcanimicrobiota bacterium]
MITAANIYPGQTQFQPYPIGFGNQGSIYPGAANFAPTNLALLKEVLDVFNLIFTGFSGFGGGAPTPGFGNGNPQPGYGNPQVGYPQAPQPEPRAQVTAQAVGQISQNFDQIDLNDDGFLSSNEVGLRAQQLSRDGIQANERDLYETLTQLDQHNPELMFLSIQSGDAAWFGLSQQDLQGLEHRLEAGQTVDSISQQLQHQVLRDRHVAYGSGTSPDEAFRRYVEQQRQRVLR